MPETLGARSIMNVAKERLNTRNNGRELGISLFLLGNTAMLEDGTVRFINVHVINGLDPGRKFVNLALGHVHMTDCLELTKYRHSVATGNIIVLAATELPYHNNCLQITALNNTTQLIVNLVKVIVHEEQFHPIHELTSAKISVFTKGVRHEMLAGFLVNNATHRHRRRRAYRRRNNWSRYVFRGFTSGRLFTQYELVLPLLKHGILPSGRPFSASVTWMGPS